MPAENDPIEGDILKRVEKILEKTKLYKKCDSPKTDGLEIKTIIKYEEENIKTSSKLNDLRVVVLEPGRRRITTMNKSEEVASEARQRNESHVEESSRVPTSQSVVETLPSEEKTFKKR